MSFKYAIIFFGPSGSGKSYWRSWTVSKVTSSILKSYTTRPPRNFDDQEYNFICDKTFSYLFSCNLFINVNCYNNEMYGVLKNDLTKLLNNNNIILLVSNLTNLQKLNKEINSIINNTKLLFVYCKSKNAEINKRLTNRNNPERIILNSKELQIYKSQFKKYTQDLNIFTIENEIDAMKLISNLEFSC